MSTTNKMFGLGAIATVVALLTSCAAAGSQNQGAGGDGEGAEESTSTVAEGVPPQIQERGVLRVGVKCDYPPFGYEEADGSHAGYEIDVVNALAEKAFGSEDAVELICVSAANRVSMLTNDRVDMLVATLGKTAEREEVMTYSKIPYYVAGHAILIPKESAVQDWEDLNGESVISLQGSTGSTLLESCFPEVEIQEYEATSDSLTALNQGRGAAFIYDTSFYAGLLASTDKYKVVGDVLAPSGAGIGMNKEDSALHAWVDATMDELAEEDVFWTRFTEWVTDEGVLESFTGYIPRPDSIPEYPSGNPAEAC